VNEFVNNYAKYLRHASRDISATITKKLWYRRETPRRTISWNIVNCCTSLRKITFEKDCSGWM